MSDSQRKDGQDAEFVEVIERLLAEVKAGHVDGVAYALMRPSGDMVTNVCWASGSQAALLIAATALLHQRAMEDAIAALDDDEEDLSLEDTAPPRGAVH